MRVLRASPSTFPYDSGLPFFRSSGIRTLLNDIWRAANRVSGSGKRDFVRMDWHHFLHGCERGRRRREDSLNHAGYVLDSGDYSLGEREDLPERADHFPGHAEDSLRLCDNGFRLPEQGLRRSDNCQSRSDNLQSRSEDLQSRHLSHWNIITCSNDRF